MVLAVLILASALRLNQRKYASEYAREIRPPSDWGRKPPLVGQKIWAVAVGGNLQQFYHGLSTLMPAAGPIITNLNKCTVKGGDW